MLLTSRCLNLSGRRCEDLATFNKLELCKCKKNQHLNFTHESRCLIEKIKEMNYKLDCHA